jgi:hypothetical protein
MAGDFICNFDKGVKIVQVGQIEGIQFLTTMWPNGKNVINISAPYEWFYLLSGKKSLF